MELQLGTFPVDSVAFGPTPGWAAGRLVVDPVRVREEVLRDPRIRAVGVELVEPGEATRIVQVHRPGPRRHRAPAQASGGHAYRESFERCTEEPPWRDGNRSPSQH
jgi:hypothetical protein